MRSLDDWLILHFFGWNKFDKRANLKIHKQTIDNGSDKVVFLFPFWTGKSKHYRFVVKKLGDKYNYVLYDYPKEILSKSSEVSLHYLREIVKDAKGTITNLRKKGEKEIILIGSSFGSDLAVCLANSVRVDKVVVNMMDKNFVKPIFESPALSILKNHYKKQGITLKQLDKLYKFISPEYNLANLGKNHTKFLFIISKYDIFCTKEELNPLFSKLSKLKVDYQIYTHIFTGHVLSMVRNLLMPKRIINFIQKK